MGRAVRRSLHRSMNSSGDRLVTTPAPVSMQARSGRRLARTSAEPPRDRAETAPERKRVIDLIRIAGRDVAEDVRGVAGETRLVDRGMPHDRVGGPDAFPRPRVVEFGGRSLHLAGRAGPAIGPSPESRRASACPLRGGLIGQQNVHLPRRVGSSINATRPAPPDVVRASRMDTGYLNRTRQASPASPVPSSAHPPACIGQDDIAFRVGIKDVPATPEPQNALPMSHTPHSSASVYALTMHYV